MARKLAAAPGWMARLMTTLAVLLTSSSALIGSAHASCTVVNHSPALLQIRVLVSPGANATVAAGTVITQVEVAANSTVNLALPNVTALLQVVNTATSDISPVLAIADGLFLLVETSAGTALGVGSTGVKVDVLLATSSAATIATLCTNL